MPVRDSAPYTVNTTIFGLKLLSRFGIILQLAQELTLVKKMIQNLRIKTPGPSFMVINMSGGNQQKVILARWLSIGARISSWMSRPVASTWEASPRFTS